LTNERKPSWQFAKWVFKTLYSPLKAFDEIVDNPDVKGPILILIIMLPLITGGQYISASKFYFENPTPEGDLWTEKSSNSTSLLWTPSDHITYDTIDYIEGNTSVSSSLTNSSALWMHLTNVGSFNCSQEEYSRLSFKMKWINEEDRRPTATLQLFSFNNESNRFELDLTPLIANNSNVWANITVQLTIGNWLNISAPRWNNITGIGFQLIWHNPANLTMKIDDLFFGKYVPALSSDISEMHVIYSLLHGSVDFLLKWLLLSAVVWLALKSVSNWDGFWKNLFSIVGYVYSALIITSGAFAILYYLLPPLFFPYRATYPAEYVHLYQSSWGTPILFLSVLSFVWPITLCTISVREIQELPWVKALFIGFGAVLISLTFSSLILSFVL
jgi:hypothetical protein